jgi:hypothetical protein
VNHRLPIEDHLDLHAFAPRDIPSVVEDYINAAHEAGLREVRLIHGRGKGVQRGIVQQALERHPLVAEFWDATETHLGATVARLGEGSGCSRTPRVRNPAEAGHREYAVPAFRQLLTDGSFRNTRPPPDINRRLSQRNGACTSAAL